MKWRMQLKKKNFLSLLKSSVVLLMLLAMLSVSSCSGPTVDDMVEDYNQIFDSGRRQ